MAITTNENMPALSGPIGYITTHIFLGIPLVSKIPIKTE